MARNNWPEPPKNNDGSPKSWIVVTQEFNNAAEIGMYRSFPNNNLFELKRKKNDFRVGHLVAFYDESYDSFHLQRCFEDGDKETVYNPSSVATPISYKDILDLMLVWQRVANCNAAYRNENGRDVTGYSDSEDINRIIYKNALAP